MLQSFLQLRRDASFSAVLAGCLAVLIGYAGPMAIVFQAAHAALLPQPLVASWIWAISIGSGVTGLWLSWRLRSPIIAAWSTPGAALLVGLLPGIPYAEAIGAYMACGALIGVIGWSGLFDRLIHAIPPGIAAGLLAGILFRFGTQVFTTAQINPLLVMCMWGTYVLARRWAPRYAILCVLVTGCGLAGALGQMQSTQIDFRMAAPVLTWPVWSPLTLLNVGLPLALVTLTGQHLPGMAVLRGAGYRAQAKGIVGLTGAASCVLAPFGCHSVNLSAITAAICTGKEAHEQPERRYVAGITSGVCCIAIGIFGETLAAAFQATPPELIGALAGLALLNAIGSNVAAVVQDTTHREASMLTFVVAASGMQWLGLGAAFWALALGGAACVVLHRAGARPA